MLKLKNFLPYAFILLISIGLLALPLKTDKKKPKNQGTHPGYLAQWFNMKKNASGVIPMGNISSWLKSDEANKVKASRAINPFSDIRELGPLTMGGRTRALLVDRSSDQRIFAGSITGGLWLSENGGVSWKPVNDQMANLVISCITQSPFNSNVLYLGTGESRGNTMEVPGEGIFKSTDGGLTFSQLSSSVALPFSNVWAIAHSQTDSSTIYVGTHTNGLWRSTNGGSSWVNVIPSGSITDIETFEDGSLVITRSTSGLFKSVSGDQGSFTKLTNGLPASSDGRIEVSSCKAFPKVMFALYEDVASDNSKLYKSSDGGQNWVLRSTVATGGSQYIYCLMLGVHIADSNYLVTGGVVPRISTNGGSSWLSLVNTHSDYHSFYNFNSNKDYFLIGNDGGVFKHYWKNRNQYENLNVGYHTIQFYGGNCYPKGISAVSGTQDNGTHRIRNGVHHQVFGADGGISHISFQDSNLGYIETQYGGIRKSTNITAAFPSFAYIGAGILDDHYFISPFEINPADGNQLYFLTLGGLWRTVNTGINWTKLSKVIGNMKAIYVENKSNPRVYFGGGGARIFRIDNAATSASQLEKDFSNQVPNAVTTDFIGEITGNDDSLGVLFVAFSNYSQNPKIYKVSNAHLDTWTWTNISGNLPLGLPVNMVVQDPVRPEFLYAATDFGLYYTDDGGVRWYKEKRIPNVPIPQIRYRKNDRSLFLFTHGRGMWYMTTTGSTVMSLQKQNTAALNIYPNPASGSINLDGMSEDGRVTLFDMRGVKHIDELTTNNLMSLNVSHLPSGNYIVQWQGKNQNWSSKIVLLNP